MTVKPSNISKLALQYGISYETMKKWIDKKRKRIGKPVGNIYSIKQVLIIYKIYGTPGTTFEEE